MAVPDVPEDVQSFIDSCIDSVEQLSVLLLLRADPKRVWSSAEITAELRSTDSSIANRLEALYHSEVLVRRPELGGRHQYTPSSERVRLVVDRLSEVYRVRPYRIIEAIYSGSSKGLRAFTNAFRFKKRKEKE